jgi:hypothetical protein
MNPTNNRIKQLAERLFLAMFTTLTIVSISIIHSNLEQSVINHLLNSSLQPSLTIYSQFLNSPTPESVAFICPTP